MGQFHSKSRAMAATALPSRKKGGTRQISQVCVGWAIIPATPRAHRFTPGRMLFHVLNRGGGRQTLTIADDGSRGIFRHRRLTIGSRRRSGELSAEGYSHCDFVRWPTTRPRLFGPRWGTSGGKPRFAGNPPPVCGCIRAVDRYTDGSSSELFNSSVVSFWSVAECCRSQVGAKL